MRSILGARSDDTALDVVGRDVLMGHDRAPPRGTLRHVDDDRVRDRLVDHPDAGGARRARASIEAMGIVLLGLSIGSMTGILGAGALVGRLGTRPLVLLGGALPVLGMLLVAVLAPAQSTAGVWVGLFLIGFGAGVAEIGLNVEAAAVERALGRPVVPVLHACFSLGTVLGGATGIALTAARTPVLVHLALATVVMAALAGRPP